MDGSSAVEVETHIVLASLQRGEELLVDLRGMLRSAELAFSERDWIIVVADRVDELQIDLDTQFDRHRCTKRLLECAEAGDAEKLMRLGELAGRDFLMWSLLESEVGQANSRMLHIYRYIKAQCGFRDRISNGS